MNADATRMERARQTAIRRVFYPALQRRHFPTAAKHLQLWRALERSSPAERDAYANAARLAILRHATAAVPYFRGLASRGRWHGQLEDLSTPAGWLRIPILTKRILRDRNRHGADPNRIT